MYPNKPDEQALLEWRPPAAYLKWKLSRPALIAMFSEFIVGIVGAIVIFSFLHNLFFACFFFLFSIIMGFAVKRMIPRTNAASFRALEDGIESSAKSQRQYLSYGNVSSCKVEHKEFDGSSFAILNFSLSPRYAEERKWSDPKVFGPIPIGEGAELDALTKIFSEKGIEMT